MAKEVRLPKLGQSMKEGTIVGILIEEGDEIKKGDSVFEIETDKATILLESPVEGFVKRILVDCEQTVPVNTPIMVIGEQDEELPEGYLDSLSVAQVDTDSMVTAPAAESANPASAPSGVIKDAPEAEIIPLADADIETHAEDIPCGYPESFEPGKVYRLSREQRKTGRMMLQSKHQIPCFYLTAKVNVTEAVKILTESEKTTVGKTEVKLSIEDMVIRAIALGLDSYPIMSGSLGEGAIRIAERKHIGFTIASDDCVKTAIIKDADKKTLAQIALSRKGLENKASFNELTEDDIEGACITLTSLAAFDVDAFIPIVIPGQCSIIGAGRIKDTPVYSHHELTAAKTMNLTISVDHRIANGADAAQFLDLIKKQLEHPAELL
jgi:pyruvate dehydrogenase E2 component (dihydrolipoamide acetyltransferase)